jgi:hypothetical protein
MDEHGAHVFDVQNVHPVRVVLHRLAPILCDAGKIPQDVGGRSLENPIYSAPGGDRTHNLLIRSQALYPLSYGGMFQIITEK